MADMLDTPDSGTEQATPDHDDTAAEWDFYDPDEDTVETPDEEATADGETDDEDAEQSEETEAEADEDTSEAEQSAEETFQLPNGEAVTRDELLKGYLRQSDYSRKTDEVAQDRHIVHQEARVVHQEAQRIHNITEDLIDFIASNVPDEPNALLRQTDPAAYNAQLARHNATMRQVHALIQHGSVAQQVVGAMTDSERQQMVASESAKLVQFVPETATPKGREAFFGAVGEAAQHYGFSEQEMNATIDSRIFRMAHDAAQWRRAQAKRGKAKAKVKAAPSAPRRPAGKVRGSGNRDAMQRLSKSGSIHDAVKVDFD